MDGRSRIAWNLRRFRTAKSLTQEALAFDAHIDRTTVSEIENESFNVSIDILERLAQALAIDVGQLLLVPPKGEQRPEPIRPGRKRKRAEN